MVLAGLALTGMVTCVKVARAELSAVEIVLWRGLVAIPLAALVASRLDRGFRIVNRRLMAVRALVGFGAMISFFTAARGMGVADLTLVMRLQPVAVAVLAPLALGAVERPGRRIWLLLVAGLLGCALLLGPDLRMGSVYGLWALLSMLLSSGAHTSLRALAPTDRSPPIVFWFQVAVTSLAFLAVVAWTRALPTVPSPALWPWLAGVGAFATLGQLLMTRAYALDRASVVAGASHVTPVWAVLADVLLFSRVPGWNVLAGGGIVLTAAMALLFTGEDREAAGVAKRSET